MDVVTPFPTATRTVNVLVVDDHPLLRRGIATTLDAEDDLVVVAEAGDADEALLAAAVDPPDVVLLDLLLPGADGLHVLTELTEVAPDARVLVLSVSDDAEHLLAALRSGAAGYLLKGAGPVELVRAVRAVARGSTVVDPALHAQLAAGYRSAPVAPGAVLTVREMEVLRQLTTGHTNRVIAAALFISDNTVKNHVRSILEKLGAATRTEAVAWALSAGVVEPSLGPAPTARRAAWPAP